MLRMEAGTPSHTRAQNRPPAGTASIRATASLRLHGRGEQNGGG
jgi:hypothetical protein